MAPTSGYTRHCATTSPAHTFGTGDSVSETVANPPQRFLFHRDTAKLSNDSVISQLADDLIVDPPMVLGAATAPNSTEFHPIISPPRKTLTKHPPIKFSPMELPSNAVHRQHYPNGKLSTVVMDPTSYVQAPDTNDADKNVILLSQVTGTLPIPIAAPTTPTTDSSDLPQPDQDLGGRPLVTREEDNNLEPDIPCMDNLPDANMVQDVNNHFASKDINANIDKIFETIADHMWNQGTLLYRVLWKCGTYSWVPCEVG
jgi:hypothetical protein